eukprot:SAG22_NODE_8157_length_678_cov_1.063903_1_plen_146_part_10
MRSGAADKTSRTRLDRRGPCDGPEDEHRCSWCNLFFRTAGALKRHRLGPKKKTAPWTKANHCRYRPKRRNLKGTEVDRLVQKLKRTKLLEDAAKVSMEGRLLQNKIEQEYLGHMLVSRPHVPGRWATMRAPRARLARNCEIRNPIS